MATPKPSDEKFQVLGYPREPASYKKIMQSINQHWKFHHDLCNKLDKIKKTFSKRVLRITALKKQLTLVTKERDELVKRYNLVWDKKQNKLVEKS